MNKTVKRYYDLAYDYHLSATILWMQIIDAPYIYSPTIFLLRHTTELLLKGLIIKENIRINPSINISHIEIQENNAKRNLNVVHSLFYLWDNFKQLNITDRLVPYYSLQQEHSIDKIIKFFNDKDYNSTTFRYPFSKQGKPIIIDPIHISHSNVAPSLGTTPPKMIRRDDEIYFIKKGTQYISRTLNLFDVIEMLFQFYGK